MKISPSISKSLIIFVFFALFLKASVAQKVVAPPKTTSLYSEDWFAAELRKVPEGTLPDEIAEAALERLENERNVTDRTVTVIVNHYISAEAKASTPHYLFKTTKPLIQRFIDALDGRSLLKSTLHSQISELYSLEGDVANSEKEAAAAYEIMEPLHAETQVAWLTSMVNLADLQMKLGKKENAESLYLRAFNYRWSELHKNREAMLSAKAQYEKAGLALVNLRWGNIKMLNQISLYGSTSENLKEYLDHALQYARESKEK